MYNIYKLYSILIRLIHGEDFPPRDRDGAHLGVSKIFLGDVWYLITKKCIICAHFNTFQFFLTTFFYKKNFSSWVVEPAHFKHISQNGFIFPFLGWKLKYFKQSMATTVNPLGIHKNAIPNVTPGSASMGPGKWVIFLNVYLYPLVP